MNAARYRLSLVLLLCCLSTAVHAITLVYNLKFRRAFDTRHYDVSLQKKNHYIVSVLPIVNKASRHVVDPQQGVDVCNSTLLGGSILNIKYFHTPSWWVEMTTAVAQEKLQDRGTHVAQESRTGLDDIVFTGGYNFYPNKRLQIVLYGLGGIPIQKAVTPAQQYAFLVGSRFYSLGLGSEFSYAFLQSKERSIVGIVQNRFIHFFSRNLVPILPPTATINPGNLTDILVAVQFRKKMTFLQVGYDLTIFTDQSITNNALRQGSPNIYRNSFYCFLNHVVQRSLKHTPLIVGVGSSYAFANQSAIKNFAAWLNVTAIF
ncbi:hypothetical protein M1466_03115 [Candidatus Dependentiae bacterium]|nr:hypothetical protein [Candidatus Dependentiae bacterium]